MSENPHNPPAFPRIASSPQTWKDGPMIYTSDGNAGSSGMSLRDYFAGQALAGLLASGQWHNSGVGFDDHIAIQAAQIADAMLREREKDPRP